MRAISRPLQAAVNTPNDIGSSLPILGTERRFYLAYLTANDSGLYVADFLNFRHMARFAPGVPKIIVYVAVSAVRPFSPIDHAALAGLVGLAERCDWLEVKQVLLKGNVGRDFSSAEACLQAIERDADPGDYVMVRNRSAYGPSREGWYRQYVDQLDRFPNTGLVGSTINFSAKPPVEGLHTHVQTYAYLSRWRHLQPLAAAFPASRCVERTEVIMQGEIGLSQQLLARGLGLSCLHWPWEQFTRERPTAEYLPHSDTKRSARSVPLRYKYPQYFWSKQDLPAQLAWCWHLRTGRAREIPALAALPPIVLDRYGAVP
jgi:hypothetical protein